MLDKRHLNLPDILILAGLLAYVAFAFQHSVGAGCYLVVLLWAAGLVGFRLAHILLERRGRS